MGLKISLLITRAGLTIMIGMMAGPALLPLSVQVTILGNHQASLLPLTLHTGVLILIDHCGDPHPWEAMGQPIHGGMASAPWKVIGIKIL